MKNLVVGGGISGLIFCYYNPEFFLITDELGGWLNHEKKFGGMVLWDTLETRQLLLDLGFPIQTVRERTYYYYNNKIYNEAPLVLRREYFFKRMGELSEHTDFIDVELGKGEENFIDGLQVDFSELIKRLIQVIEGRKQICVGKAIRFSDTSVDVDVCDGEKGKTLFFDKLVTTIAAPLFWKMWQGTECKEVCTPSEFKHVPVTCFSFDKLTGKLRDMLINSGKLTEDFRNTIYFLEDSPFHRLTRTSEDNYSVHFSGVIEMENGSQVLGIPVDKLHRRVLTVGQFLNHNANFPPKNVMFLGRFAQWQYKVKVQDIVRMSRFSKFMLEDMRHRQSRFNKNFMPFEKLGFTVRQALSEKWILYAISELTELLDETNWKLHRLPKELSREKILEEWIDTLKFVFGIADIWGFTNAEIYEAFHRKSDFVENRFREDMIKKESTDV